MTVLTNPVHVLDLAFFLPAAVLVGVWMRHRARARVRLEYPALDWATDARLATSTRGADRHLSPASPRG